MYHLAKVNQLPLVYRCAWFKNSMWPCSTVVTQLFCIIELEDGSQIKFNKPVVNEHGEEHGGPDGSYSSFTVVMPEYTIGSKKKKVIKKTCVDTRNSSAHRMLTLSHLEDNEDEA